MSLVDEIDREVRDSGPGGRCPVPGFLFNIGAEDAQVVTDAMAARKPATAIARVFSRRGHVIRADALRTHYNGGCKCLQ